MSVMKFEQAEQDLYKVILMLKNEKECKAFFRDLCTPAELKAMAERWLVARLLYEHQLSYRQIHEQTGVSIATITRVARFLNHEEYDGYRIILQRLKASEK